MENNLAEQSLQSSFGIKDTSIFYLSHLLALFPFNQNRELKFKWISLLYSLILILGLMFLLFTHVQNIQQTETSNTNILLYAGYALINTLFSITCIIAPIANRDSIKSIIKGLSDADAIIKHFQPDFKFKGMQKRQSIQVLFTITISMLFIFIYLKASEENMFPSFTNTEFYILPVTWLVVFQMDYFMIHLRERFILINSQLENALQENDTFKHPNSIQVISNLNVFSLNKINHVHFTLYKISTEINNVYGAQLLIMIPRVIFFCVLPVHYNIVTALVRDPNDNSSSQLWTHVFTLMYIGLLTSPVIYAVNVASNTVNQAKKIHILIHDLIDEDQEEPVEYELLIFSIQLLHRHIDFSVHEFFSLKPSLTTAMFELIITYVIILLQFQDTLASISPIRLLLRPLHQVVSAVINYQLFTSTMPTLPENMTDFTDIFYNYTFDQVTYY